MTKIIEGKLVAKGMKFGIVASRFNDFICGRLIDGAMDALTRAGADDKDIAIYKVPGAFELPLVAKKLAKSGNKNLITDTAIAAIMLESSFFSAKFNVYINLKYIKDIDFVGEVHKVLSPLEKSMLELKEEILEMCEDVIR